MTFRFSLLFILLLWLTSQSHPGSWSGKNNPDLPGESKALLIRQIQEKYALLNEPLLNQEAFRYGMLGYHSLLMRGMVRNDSLLTIIDFSRPSVDDRLFVINLNLNAIVYKSLVSHGRNSGDLYASRFSNKMQSHQSALGFYITGETYLGGQGYSLQLMGLDTGYNDHSKVRSIVVHAAYYATQDYANRYGRLGRSFGCLALPPAMNAPIVNEIKGGSVVFSYFPDQTYLNRSVILQGL
jgi:hypothetical protein